MLCLVGEKEGKDMLERLLHLRCTFKSLFYFLCWVFIFVGKSRHKKDVHPLYLCILIILDFCVVDLISFLAWNGIFTRLDSVIEGLATEKGARRENHRDE